MNYDGICGAVIEERDRLRAEVERLTEMGKEFQEENEGWRVRVNEHNEEIASLRTANAELLEAARELLDFIRARFPADFGEGGKGFTCPHHIKLAAAIAKAEGKL